MEIMPIISRNYNNYGKHKFGQTENKGTQIFSNMPNWQNTIQGQKKDEFLSKNSKKKFNLQTIKSNKKLIITKKKYIK